MPDRVGPCRGHVGTVPDRAVPIQAVSPCWPDTGTPLLSLRSLVQATAWCLLRAATSFSFVISQPALLQRAKHNAWTEHSCRRGAVDREFGLYFGGLGPQDRSQRRENGREKPGGRFSGPGDHSGPISGHFRRFWARPPICDLNIVTLPHLRLLRFQHWHSGDV